MRDFNILIFLVGTNPLPNFVVAEYFLNNNQFQSLNEIILLYSEETQYQGGTKEYAENLQKLIKSRHQNRNLKFHLMHLSNISSAKEIERDLRDGLMSHLKNNLSIHLNYTGGTKVMANHVYRWIENYVKEKIITASFSYLDARTFQIVSDEDGRITGDLRNQIGISLEELIKLHGFERTNEPSDASQLFEDAIKEFKKLIEADRLKDYFATYNRKIFTDDKGNLLQNKQRVKENVKNKCFIAQGTFLEIVKSMPEDYRLFNDNGSFKEPTTNKYF
jgi:hypothetical protein